MSYNNYASAVNYTSPTIHISPMNPANSLNYTSPVNYISPKIHIIPVNYSDEEQNYSNEEQNYSNEEQNYTEEQNYSNEGQNYSNEEYNVLCSDCIETHDQKYGQNYVWLDALGHGPVQLVWFSEPADSNEFILYTTEWWKAHCKAVSHDENLFEAHYNAFVNPETRFAKMVFLFEDGTLKEANEEFYRLEQDYYDNEGLCHY